MTDGSATREEIRQIEEAALAAWPALMTVHDDGMVIRLANGFTKRANSANVLHAPSGSGPQDRLAQVERVERLYARHGQRAAFRLTPLAEPPLDALLDERGYTLIEPSLVLARTLKTGEQAAPSPLVMLKPGAGTDWIAGFSRASRLDGPQTSTLARMLAVIAAPHVTAAVVENGHPIAFGLGVADRGSVGAFDILVDPAHRKRGLARQIMAAILDWGRREGAVRAYLQVVATNAPAIALYKQLGYQLSYRYHYRVASKDR